MANINVTVGIPEAEANHVRAAALWFTDLPTGTATKTLAAEVLNRLTQMYDKQNNNPQSPGVT